MRPPNECANIPALLGKDCSSERRRVERLTMDKRTPVFFFAPFVSSTMRVDPAWIDYNGHMNMA